MKPRAYLVWIDTPLTTINKSAHIERKKMIEDVANRPHMDTLLTQFHKEMLKRFEEYTIETTA